MGGIYFGNPRGIFARNGERIGINTEIYREHEIERVAHRAFQLARVRRHKVTSVDKANVLESSRLWRDVVNRIGRSYPDVALKHLYVDSCPMEKVAEAGETSIERILKRGVRTAELPGRKRPVGTSRVGDLVAEATQKFLKSSKFRAA